MKRAFNALDHILCDPVDLLFGVHAWKWVKV
jgi:hypothetical protein